MPFRREAFIIVAFFFGSFGSWLDVRYQNSPDDQGELPAVPGCRLFRRENNLELSAFCNSFNIPETPSSLPENTTRLQIYRVNDLDVGQPLLKNLLNLRELELPQNDLVVFSSGILEGLSNLKALSLRNNRIKRLSDGTFVHNPLLEKIDLSGNMILSVVTVTPSLRNLTHLREIDLADNMIISSLTYLDFEPLQNTSLRSLFMSGCPIGTIDEDAFRPLRNLSQLDLSFTLLDTTAVRNITRSLEPSRLQTLKLNNMRLLHIFPFQFFKFLNMSPVQAIDISFNRFSDFPLQDNIFPDLKFLDMTFCYLQDRYILLDSFKGTPKLETLILKRNEISGIRKQFSHLTKLKTLDISDHISPEEVRSFTIEDYAFRSLGNLEYLNLEGQPIRQAITRYTFHGLAGLSNLRLSRCGIKMVEGFAFETLHSLKTLDLSYNFIETLGKDTLYGLRNLKTLNLKKNIVTSLNRSNPFKQTPVLESIVLNDNKIAQLPPGIFAGLPQLGVIRLANNVIVPWHKPIFAQHSDAAAYLEINENRIDYFTPEMLDDVRYLEALDFSRNPLNCSVCGMFDLQLWMKNTSTNIRGILRQSDTLAYACVEPPQLANVSILDAEIPVTHCIPEELNVVLLSLCITVPFFGCLLLAFIVWHFLAWHIRYCCFRVKAKVRVYKEIAKSDKYKYDAFVSYSPADLLWVRDSLIPALESGDPGNRLCVPDRDFEASFNITENVFQAVQNSRTTILVLSNAYLESEWCKFDMDMAQHKLFEDTRSLIVILLEEVDSAKITKNLKYIIKTRTFIPWTDNSIGQRLFWERLRLAVARPNDRVLSKHIP